MNLRDHVEIAVLISRLGMDSGWPAGLWDAETKSRFWNQTRYLEHLWKKGLAKERLAPGGFSQTLLIEEILACRLLIRVVAAATASLEEWQQHTAVVQQLLHLQAESTLDEMGYSRLGRLRKRLDHWGDFLVSRSSTAELYGTDPERCREFRISYRFQDEAIWTLFLKGISHAVPSRQIDDAPRRAVQRLLQSTALTFIPEDVFLADGRPKPRLMRLIELEPRRSDAIPSIPNRRS